MQMVQCFLMTVLNLIINGLPSKLNRGINKDAIFIAVLNLIINGLPSKPKK